MKLGKLPISNADKAKPQIAYLYEGEERIDRRPSGRVERWVDLVGNVVSLQMYADGDPNRATTDQRMRLQFRKEGFIEHAKCPVRHGTYLLEGPIAKDFRTIKGLSHEPCAGDPRTLIKKGDEIHATEACPHIEALIKYRVANEAKQAAARNRKRAAEEKQAAEEAELKALQLEKLREERGKKKPGGGNTGGSAA